VFPAPSRAALGASDYRECCTLNEGALGKGLSKHGMMSISSRCHTLMCFSIAKALTNGMVNSALQFRPSPIRL
jgi:predicted RNase H-like nuclease